jgi:hypothetical protein
MSPDPSVPVSVLLDAIRKHAEEVGQRRAAADIGMSAGGFHALLHGTNPHPGTVAKLRAWYLMRSPIGLEQAEAILGLLLEHLPTERQSGIARKILRMISEEGRVAEVEAPGWLRVALRQQ